MQWFMHYKVKLIISQVHLDSNAHLRAETAGSYWQEEITGAKHKCLAETYCK